MISVNSVVQLDGLVVIPFPPLRLGAGDLYHHFVFCLKHEPPAGGKN